MDDSGAGVVDGGAGVVDGGANDDGSIVEGTAASVVTSVVDSVGVDVDMVAGSVDEATTVVDVDEAAHAVDVDAVDCVVGDVVGMVGDGPFLGHPRSLDLTVQTVSKLRQINFFYCTQ